jgi:hypothetical protein
MLSRAGASGQFEQVLNGRYLQRLGYGQYAAPMLLELSAWNAPDITPDITPAMAPAMSPRTAPSARGIVTFALLETFITDKRPASGNQRKQQQQFSIGMPDATPKTAPQMATHGR